MIKLRGYQEDAIKAVLADLDSGVKRPAVILPTGAGKTVVFSALISQWQKANGGKALVLAHREELVQQAKAKYLSVAPGSHVGIIKASTNEVDADVVIASVQTLVKEARRSQLKDVNLIIVDECHHASAQTYKTILEYFDVPTIGFTATMARGDVWEKISYERSILRMIRERHLVDVKGIQVKVPDLDLKGVKKTGGDYSEGDLGECLLDSLAPETVASAYREHCADLPGILFAPTVQTAHVFTDALVERGFKAATIWGAMPKELRVQTLKDFEDGKIQILTNCMVLTEGFDSPRATVAVIARPTQSAPLFIQMVGRVLRTWPGKECAIVLDVVGAAQNHELATLNVLTGSKDKRILKQGESLLKALDEYEDEDRGEDDDAYRGPVELKDVDLFAGSRQQWLKSLGGFWFLPAGNRVITLMPIKDSTSFDVAWFHTTKKGGGFIAKDVADLGYAMAQGESDITEVEEVLARRDGKWRKRKATDKQRSFAKQLNLKLPDDGLNAPRAGAVADLISIALASKRIDGPIQSRL